MEIDENNVYKSKGQIRFKVEKLSEFARAPFGTKLLSDVVFVRGLPWRILVVKRLVSLTSYLCYYLQCNADNPDPGWSCAAKAKLKVLSQKEGKEDYVDSFKHVYSAKDKSWGFADTFKKLMAPENGWYDEQSDSIVIMADITADVPLGLKNNVGQFIPFANAKPNATITVDKEEVEVNSHILTLYSAYFERNFFDDRYPPAENIELPPFTTIDDFKQLLAILPPEQRPLDDDCVEAILILADRFSMDTVMELCRDFLLIKSRKPKLFKFRMAHKYGWNETKDAILRSMRPDDFSNFEKFMENAEEYAMLDGAASSSKKCKRCQHPKKCKMVSSSKKVQNRTNFQKGAKWCKLPKKCKISLI